MHITHHTAGVTTHGAKISFLLNLNPRRIYRENISRKRIGTSRLLIPNTIGFFVYKFVELNVIEDSATKI